MSSITKKTDSDFNHEETINYIIQAQNGSSEAQEWLVKNNMGLVRSVVKRFLNRGYEAEDLMQIGSIGLIKAIKKFDISYNVRFSTYAVPMIIGEIKRFLRDDGMVKVSRSLKQTAAKVNIAKEKLSKVLGRDATIEEISKEIKIDKEDIVMAIESCHTPEYLYDVIHQNNGSPIHLIDRIDGDTNLGLDIVDKITIKEVIGKLKPRERQIIIMRYFNDKTQTEIASMLGISQVQVSRIEKKVLENMKKMLKKV
ncbi:RNA polymerase sporulation sigma factor SigF [Abyssisolibacter fermentans]|uniref:RNA polymerase sporulation sigma factor SigF n=1 Tax=Abyssisolibacter fermentans TaxID=1766203 RepID=UPI00082B591D|nr:RNA polymerase sporulation sigma factor SigF [Abyssisolibacter fermentans]